jgi:hypothetical protein
MIVETPATSIALARWLAASPSAGGHPVDHLIHHLVVPDARR